MLVLPVPSENSGDSGKKPADNDKDNQSTGIIAPPLSRSPSLKVERGYADNEAIGDKARPEEQEPHSFSYSYQTTQESVIDEAETSNTTSGKTEYPCRPLTNQHTPHRGLSDDLTVSSGERLVDMYTTTPQVVPYSSVAYPFAYHPQNSRSSPGPPTLIPGSYDFRETFLRTQVPRSSGDCTLRIDDTLTSFVKSELEPGDSIRDLVVLTGSPQSLWATTCQDYVRRIWPGAADQILGFFDGVSRLAGPTHTMEITNSGQKLSVSCQEIVSTSNNKELSMKLATNPQSLSSTVEALAWLYATVQYSTEGVAASGVYLEQSGLFFRFASYDLVPLSRYGPDPASSCWMPLVPHAASAVGFSTPVRPPGLQGMEVSFELMCYLCGLEYEVVEEGGPVLYGPKSMVYPVRQIYDCVEWHFQPLDTGSIDNFRRDGAYLKLDGVEELRSGKRHFIGLWADPQVTLGTSAGDVSGISWSRASEVRQELTRDGRSFGGTIFFPKALNLTWTETFKVARSRKTVYLTNFEAKLQAAINTPVMLYSVSEKRAWMVSFVSVLLHVARARAHCQRSLGFRVPTCDISANGGQAAYETIMSCYRGRLKHAAPDEMLDELEESLTIKDYINDVWAALDCATRETKKTKGLFRTQIIGYEMADIARLKSTLRMKRQSLDAFATGWAPLLDEVKLALFCEGLHDPIVSNPDQQPSNPCSESIWPKIPMGHNILTASLPCLRELCEHLNEGRCGPRLTSEYVWHNPGQSRSIFATCKKKSKHVCNRLQELHDLNSAAVSNPSYSNLMENPNGAVIFRYNDKMETIQASVNSMRSSRLLSPNSMQPAQASSSSMLANPSSASDSDSGYSSPRPEIHEVAADLSVPVQASLEDITEAIPSTPPPRENDFQVVVRPKSDLQVQTSRRNRAKSYPTHKRPPISRSRRSDSTKGGTHSHNSKRSGNDAVPCVIM